MKVQGGLIKGAIPLELLELSFLADTSAIRMCGRISYPPLRRPLRAAHLGSPRIACAFRLSYASLISRRTLSTSTHNAPEKSIKIEPFELPQRF